jgi:hypothetical protein
MRTTVRLRDDLLRRAKRRAAEEGRTLTSIIEEGVRLVLARPRPRRREHVEVPVCSATGGVLPSVDLNRSSDLVAVMDDT